MEYKFFESDFTDITFQMMSNTGMDLASILVVLILNRKTIKLRKILKKKQKDKEEELKWRQI